MITDEQIKQLAVSCGFKLTNETGDDLKPYVYAFARRLIAMAHEVKPLEWRYDRKAFYFAYAYTSVGKYEIDDFDSSFMVSFGYVCIAQNMKTDADAISAANADFKQRVLGCLVHGGDK